MVKRKMSSLAGNRTPFVQLVHSLFTDWDFPGYILWQRRKIPINQCRSCFPCLVRNLVIVGKRYTCPRAFFLNEHHAMKQYWGSGGIALHILDLGTRWRWVFSLTSRPLYHQGKCPRYPLDMRLGRPQSRSGRGVEVKNSQPPPEFEPRSSDRSGHGFCWLTY
jgi:hypothetical protein